MAERQTIADSKRAFHQAFPHVIGPLYRRLADELLVELHLLSHQSSFITTPLFAVGLCTVFDTFSRGYRPEDQISRLFKALCSSNGFEADALRRESESCLAAAKLQSVDEMKSYLASQRLADGAHYSRLMAIGVFRLFQTAKGGVNQPNEADLRKRCKELADSLNLPAERLEKDLSLFASNSERMTMSIELVKETVAAERRKKERRQAEQVQRSET
ncbi:photosystem II biogenesis protein Psp29 [Synechococcus sp. M16CYN]|uniref:photosystem II biogenesis protein Psp29 n=1 Tax=Synechococcus sp. M16CYN TaxID=3103139 RepID=UPI0033407B1E